MDAQKLFNKLEKGAKYILVQFGKRAEKLSNDYSKNMTDEQRDKFRNFANQARMLDDSNERR